MNHVEDGPPPSGVDEDAERRIAAAEARAVEAERKLRAVDETKNAILSAVSHELRTPLTSVIGFAEILRTRLDDLPKETRTELLERLKHNAFRLERLLGDLLDLDRLKRGILTPVRRPARLKELVARVADEATTSDRAVEIDADDVTAQIDAPKVERIIENLLANAIKHTPSHARIWLLAKERPGGVLIAVEDDGPGVADDDKHRIFQAFDRGIGSPTSAYGTGIGLTLAQRFAELHGGSIWVQDRAGGGASFRVFLPAEVRPATPETIVLPDSGARRG